jgi:hypothetical protein
LRKLELSDGEDNGGGADENLGDDGDDDGEEDDTYGAAQHVLVLLDCGSSMWKKFLPNPKHYMDATNDSTKDDKSKTDAYFYDDNDNDDDDDEKFISPMDQALQVLYDLVRQQVRVKGIVTNDCCRKRVTRPQQQQQQQQRPQMKTTRRKTTMISTINVKRKRPLINSSHSKNQASRRFKHSGPP